MRGHSLLTAPLVAIKPLVAAMAAETGKVLAVACHANERCRPSYSILPPGPEPPLARSAAGELLVVPLQLPPPAPQQSATALSPEPGAGIT